jgi:hypothetical protein
MDISYVAQYDGENKPLLLKVVTSGSDSVSTALSLSNTEETANLSDDIIWDHMRNLVQHLNYLAGTAVLVDQGISPDSGWPVSGWTEMAKLNEDIILWWVYVTQRDEEVQIIHSHI